MIMGVDTVGALEAEVPGPQISRLFIIHNTHAWQRLLNFNQILFVVNLKNAEIFVPFSLQSAFLMQHAG